MKKSTLLLAAMALVSVATLRAQTNQFVIETGKPGAAIQSTMYGVFFEDINYAADGGLYAELVKNRSFEFPQNLMGWKTFGGVELRNDGPFERNPHYVRLSNAGHSHKHTGLENEGFFGIGVEEGAEYRFSVWARVPDGGTGAIRVELVDIHSMGEQQAFATQNLAVEGAEWKKYQVVLTSEITHPKATLRIFYNARESRSAIDLEHVSLFPVDTWRGHENGMRRDIAQALADMQPGIFRFPGGCIVEGTDLETRYNWKNSVGPVENRPLNENRWHYTFAHRLFPDYFQSYGLGFFEYFVLSEEIGAEPVPIVSCGLACQFQNNDPSAHVPVDELGPYVQDALDLIEFANGGTDTEWGRLRAEMGHPEPFGLKYLGVGNEQWGPEYPERLTMFIDAIRKAYPEIKIIGSSGPYNGGEWFEHLWPEMKRLKVDLVDEHYYSPENWFLNNATRYDSYDRKGPKVFAGEFAVHGRGKKWNHFNAALIEAAYMTGLERNADIVHMAAYAPLFAHVEGWQWRPDLIWFDNLDVVTSASYHVQRLYSIYKGTDVLPLTMGGAPVTGADGQNGLYASAVWDAGRGEIIVKVANTSAEPRSLSFDFKGLRRSETISGVRRISLHSDDPDADNTLENPTAVVPVETALTVGGPVVNVELEPATFAIYFFKK